MTGQVFVFVQLTLAIIGTKMMVLAYYVLIGMMLALKVLKVMVVLVKIVFLLTPHVLQTIRTMVQE